MNETSHTKAGTAGGTLTILLANINSDDVIKTMVMAMIGAVVSFIVSHVLKKLVRWWREPPKSR
jgi:mannitol-specific phosphotransferase system IIBC component